MLNPKQKLTCGVSRIHECRHLQGRSTREQRVVFSPRLGQVQTKETTRQIVHPRCCGLDVHKKSVVACVLITADDGTVQREIRPYAPMTADLLRLA